MERHILNNWIKKNKFRSTETHTHIIESWLPHIDYFSYFLFSFCFESLNIYPLNCITALITVDWGWREIIHPPHRGQTSPQPHYGDRLKVCSKWIISTLFTANQICQTHIPWNISNWSCELCQRHIIFCFLLLLFK